MIKKFILATALLVSLPVAADKINSPSLGTGGSGSSFVQNAGLLAYYKMIECTGTSLGDSSGLGNTITFPGSNAPAWNAPDCTLDWSTTNTTFLSVPAAVQGVQTIEIAFYNGITTATTPRYNTLVGYAGANPANVLELARNWKGANNANPNQAYATSYLGWHFYDTVNPPDIVTSGTIDQDLHIATEVIDNTTPSPALIYLDGVLQENYLTTTDKSNAASGGNWQIGGSSVGTVNCGYITCGFVGRIAGVRFYSSKLTQLQITQDHKAWLDFLAQNHAYNPNAPARTVDLKGGMVIRSLGTSYTWGNGLTSPPTMNYTAVAVAGLTTALGYTVTGVVNGQDSNTSYIISGACGNLYKAMYNFSGVNIALFETNANDARVKQGAITGVTYNTGVGLPINQSAVQGLLYCTKLLQSRGWKVINTTAWSILTDNTDTNSKDIFNPLMRQILGDVSDGFMDAGTDARWGADNAAAAGGVATSCFGGPAYQAGNIHGTDCAESVFGKWLQAVVLSMQNNGQIRTTTVSSLPFQGTGLEIGGRTILTATGIYTMVPCGGFLPGKKLIIKASGIIGTVRPGTEYNGGSQDAVDGSTADMTLTAGTTAILATVFAGDTVGGCSWTRLQ